LLADLFDAAVGLDWKSCKQPRLRRAHPRTIAGLFAIAALVVFSSIFCVDNQRAAVAREPRKFVDCLEDTVLDFAVAREITIDFVVLDVPFPALREQRSIAFCRRERKRCVVTVPNALNYLASFVEIGEVALRSRSAGEKPDHWHRVLLGMCREQPGR